MIFQEPLLSLDFAPKVAEFDLDFQQCFSPSYFGETHFQSQDRNVAEVDNATSEDESKPLKDDSQFLVDPAYPNPESLRLNCANLKPSNLDSLELEPFSESKPQSPHRRVW